MYDEKFNLKFGYIFVLDFSVFILFLILDFALSCIFMSNHCLSVYMSNLYLSICLYVLSTTYQFVHYRII